MSARGSVRNAQISAPAADSTPGSPALAAVAGVAAVASAAVPPPATPAVGTPTAAETTVPGPPASEVGIQLDKVLSLPGTPPEPVNVPVPADLSKLPVEDMIRAVFGPEGDKAVQVARCESTLRTHAKKGQFLGLFQMGANERVEYGHGEDALAQVLAAHALFLDRGWQPWTCA